MDAAYGSLVAGDQNDSPFQSQAVNLNSSSFTRIHTNLFKTFLCLILVGCSVFLFSFRESPRQHAKDLVSLDSKSTDMLMLAEMDGAEECGETGRLDCCTDTKFPFLAGIDVVAYFQIPLGDPAVVGNPDIKSTFETLNGAYTFYFSTEDNKALFEENPWNYIPEVGGFDANALAGGMGFQNAYDKVPRESLGPIVDINQWTIIHNKLYLFGNMMSLRFFTLQQKALIAAADLKWMEWFDSRWVSIFSVKSDTVLNTRCVVAGDIPNFVPAEPRNEVTKTFVLAADQPEEEVEVKYDYDYEPPEDIVFNQCSTDEEKKHRTTCCGDPDYPVLGGVDVVSFEDLEDESPPIWGTDEYTATLSTSMYTYTFWFSSAENRDKFELNPWGYAPLFGGYCSFGIAKEKQFEREDAGNLIGPYIDFPAWWRYEGHLFLFGGRGPRRFFVEGADDAIESGTVRWSKWFGGLYEGTLNTRCFMRAAAKKK